jgi:hypothetical protein
MRTLRTIGEFVGIPLDSPEIGSHSDVGLRLADDLLARDGSGPRRSLRAIGKALEALTPFDLQATLLTERGVEPFEPVIRVSATSGLVISTYIYFSQNDEVLYQSPNYGAASGDFRPTQLSPGQWQIVVRRSGIGNSGYMKLERSFTARISRIAPPPAAPTRPRIEVTQSGPLNAVVYTVTGTEFLRSQQPGPQGIAIRAVDGVDPQQWIILRTTGSNEDGAIHTTLAPFDIAILSRNALGQAVLNFSAADTRTDPNSTPANEPLWSNTVTLRY